MANLDIASQAYLSNIKNISDAFAPVNQNVLNQEIAPGGALSNSLGFGEGGAIDVQGLTPEAFQQVIQQRANLFNQNLGAIQGAIALRELVTGNKEKREAALQANRDIYHGQLQSELQNNNHIFEQNLTDQKLAQEWRQFQDQLAATQKMHTETQVGENKRHADTMKLGYAHLKLEERKQKMMEDYANQNGEDASTFPASVDMFKAYQKQKEDATKQGLDQGIASHFGLASSAGVKGYATAHLSQAALGAKYGTVYNADDQDVVKKAFGFSQLRLGSMPGKPIGWYGMTTDPKTGAITYSTMPVVVLNPAGIPTKTKTKSLYPVYAPAEEE